MPIALTPATADDIPFIMACERRPGYEPFVGRWPDEQHRATLADSNYRYLIGKAGGAPIGFAILRDFDAGTGSLYLKRIAAHDAERGFGRKLLHAVTGWVFENTRFHRFWLEVVAENPRAIHVYKSSGWTHEGTIREAYAKPDGTRGSFLQLSILRREWEARGTPPPQAGEVPERSEGWRGEVGLHLNQVTVSARDIEASTRFYEILGFKLIVRSPHYRRFEIGDGAGTFSLHLADSTDGAANGPHIYFECEDLDTRVAALQAKGIVFDSAPVDQSWLWREAWLSDPAGNRLCFYRAGDARRYPPWRVP